MLLVRKGLCRQPLQGSWRVKWCALALMLDPFWLMCMQLHSDSCCPVPAATNDLYFKQQALQFIMASGHSAGHSFSTLKALHG